VPTDICIADEFKNVQDAKEALIKLSNLEQLKVFEDIPA
jgi:hypothetical protein